MKETILIQIPDIYLWGFFGALVLFFFFFAVVFSYHWTHYGYSAKARLFSKAVYFIVSLLLLFAIAFFIGLYTLK